MQSDWVRMTNTTHLVAVDWLRITGWWLTQEIEAVKERWSLRAVISDGIRQAHSPTPLYVTWSAVSMQDLKFTGYEWTALWPMHEIQLPVWCGMVCKTFSGENNYLIPCWFCPLTKKWAVYNFNCRFIWTVRDRTTAKKIQKNALKKIICILMSQRSIRPLRKTWLSTWWQNPLLAITEVRCFL